MPAYKDGRTGTWRYRKWIVLPDGTRTRLTGTPAVDSREYAEAAERAHINRALTPEPSKGPTPKEFADNLKEYLPRKNSKQRIFASCVYVLICDSPAAPAGKGPIKFGRGNPDHRRGHCQTGNPYPVRLLGWLQVTDPVQAEAELIAKFHKHRMHGGGQEWFRWTPEIPLMVADWEAQMRALSDKALRDMWASRDFV